MITVCLFAECTPTLEIPSDRGHDRREKQGSQTGGKGQRYRQVTEGMSPSSTLLAAGNISVSG